MANHTHCDAVVNLENFLSRLADGEKQNAVAITERRDRTPRSELRFDVLTAVRDRFDPTIRLFDHASVSLHTDAIFFSGRVVMPLRDTLLIRGYTFALRFSRPVAVSDSA